MESMECTNDRALVGSPRLLRAHLISFGRGLEFVRNTECAQSLEFAAG
jgi:hypothetical protein